MYDSDSFFDLTLVGRIGLLFLSSGMALGLIAVVWRGYRSRPLWLRLIGAVALLWLFVWLSPQVYYLYYRFLIPDLPLQWVLKTPPDPLDLAQLLIFQGRETLSDHGKAVLGWCLIAAALAPSIRARLAR
ncbi:MAG: hypothetical protein AAFN79_11530 [Pseudomonadota bacterium]